jgi:predicted metal-binding membrane protein
MSHEEASPASTMTYSATSLSGRLPRVIPAAIVAAWSLTVLVTVNGRAEHLHHGAPIEGAPPLGPALLLFLIAWQGMTAAMMLPSSLSMIRLFAAISERESEAARSRSPLYPGAGHGALIGAFLTGYAFVWSGFGATAFLADLALHRIANATPSLRERPWLIAGAILTLAGALQFSGLKNRFLRQCRTPSLYLARHYGRGLDGAFRLGRDHGLLQLGCCWALMLVIFAAGSASLWWMLAVTGLMAYERTAGGARVVPVAGMVLLALGILVLAHPSWAPTVL